MPSLEDAIENEDFFFKVLAYGPSQSRKTLWSGMAAMAGFNVTIFEGDGNAAILRHIPAQYRKLITIVNVIDEISRPIFWPFITRVFKGGKFAWDEQDKTYRLSPNACNLEHSHIVIDPSKLTKNDLWIVDSYTALTNSVRWNNAIQHQIDLTNLEKLDWDIYGPDSVSLNWWLPLVKSLKCHAIVIGHSTVWEKKDEKGKLIDQRTQPISSSASHSRVLAKYFTDTLYFSLVGQLTRIETSADDKRDGGSRFIPPGKYTFEDPTSTAQKRLQFSDMLEYAGITPPGLTEWQSEAVKRYKPGELPDIPGQPTGKSIQANQTNSNGVQEKQSVAVNTGVKPSTGLAAILAKKQQPASGEKK